MVESAGSGPVLVGVKYTEHVQQLVRTAGDLARQGDCRVRLVTVVVKPHDSPFGIFDDETIVREYGAGSQSLLEAAETPPGVEIDRDVYVARSAAKGILTAVSETDPAALVVGWHRDARRRDAVLGTTVDSLVDRAPCDLYVERIGHEAGAVDTVLLPVAGGPHVGAAARVATAIAARNDATVVIVSVAAGGISTEQATGYADAGRTAVDEAGGPDVPVRTEVVDAGDVTEALVAAATDHDVVVMGATRQGAIRRRLVGSVPRRVVDQTDATLILARDASDVSGALGRLGGLLRQ
jgi:nucleotide-binding universal stress UspA family protein